MKTLIIYYSFDWNTEFIADNIHRKLKWSEIERIYTKEEIVKKWKLSKYLWWWKMVMMKEEPEIIENSLNPEDFDNIIIWSPVWAWTIAPPVKTYLSKHKLWKKNIYIYCHAWWPWKVVEKFKELISWNQYKSAIWFKNPLNTDTQRQLKELIDWIEEISNDIWQ